MSWRRCSGSSYCGRSSTRGSRRRPPPTPACELPHEGIDWAGDHGHYRPGAALSSGAGRDAVVSALSSRGNQQMLILSVVSSILARVLLIVLFLPFSALDKILNFKAAVGQASEAIPSRGLA